MRVHFKASVKMVRKVNFVFLLIFVDVAVCAANVPSSRINYRKTVRGPRVYRKSLTGNFPWRRTDSEIGTAPPAIWIPISGFKMNESMSCATNLIDQHTEVCEIVFRIGQLQQLFPHLQEMIEKRMGGRKFTFTIYMSRSSTTVGMLGDAGRALLRCIAKFVRFLGYVEKLFAATVGADYDNLRNNRRGFFDATELTGFLGELGSIESFDDKEVQQIVRKAWSRKCAQELLKTDEDVCGITSRISSLDNLLKSSKVELTMSDSSMIPVKLNTDELSLTNFLDAIRVGLLGTRNIKRFRARRSMEIQERYLDGKRILLNDDHERVREIFETPEFKVELVEDETKNLQPTKLENIDNDRPSRKNMLNVISRLVDDDSDYIGNGVPSDEIIAVRRSGESSRKLRKDYSSNPPESLAEMLSAFYSFFMQQMADGFLGSKIGNALLGENVGNGAPGTALFTSDVDFDLPPDLFDSLNPLNIENILDLLQMRRRIPREN